MEQLINTSAISLTELSSAVIVFDILFAFLLSMVIALVYQHTHKGISYSQSFVISLVMMSILAALAMMILGNNLTRALGILGIFTLIRFRTIIKDTRDATFMFFALAIGMAVGTSNYTIALIGTVMMCLINYVLHKYNFGSAIKNAFMVTFVVNPNFTHSSHKQIFKNYLKSYELLHIKNQLDGSKEYYFSVRFKRHDYQESFIDELKKLEGVGVVDLITGKSAIEY